MIHFGLNLRSIVFSQGLKLRFDMLVSIGSGSRGHVSHEPLSE